MRVLEQLSAIDLSLASLVFIHNANGIRPIVGYATPVDARRTAALAGAWARAVGVRPDRAGRRARTFPASRPSPSPDGQGGWRVRGVKRWNGSGWAGVVSVFARQVDSSGRLGHATGFVVRQGMPGLRVGPESLTMGVRSIMQNSIYFDDVAVRPVHVLGEVGKGMDVADEALLVARLVHGRDELGRDEAVRPAHAPLRQPPRRFHRAPPRQPDHASGFQ